jgi:N6-L-threonylcarbamoyladenine synthase
MKGGIRKRNQAPYEVKGFRLYDKVSWRNQECFIFGRRSTGRMDLRLLDGTHINASVGYKNLRLLKMRTNYLVESRHTG